VPRGGVVNARRPGRWPGRSEAKSIDDAEPGASMKGAMVRWRDLDPRTRRRVRKNMGRGRTDFCWIRRPRCSGESGTQRRARGRRVFPARTLRADSDMRDHQRWRERPRLDGLGSLARQDSGVVHAIVGSVTATPPPAETAAHSAALMLCAQQGAATQALAPSVRSWSHQG
jgi:hypothetical protein